MTTQEEKLILALRTIKFMFGGMCTYIAVFPEKTVNEIEKFQQFVGFVLKDLGIKEGEADPAMVAYVDRIKEIRDIEYEKIN